MIEYIDIDKLNPADYNPRCLVGDALEELKNSITELGVIKPIHHPSFGFSYHGGSPENENDETARLHSGSCIHSGWS